MSFSGKDDGDLVPLESYLPFPFDKESVDLGRIAAFKPPELLGQHGVEGVGDHGHDNVEVHLDQDGGRKGIEVEKLDGLGDDVFHTPPSGVVANQQLRWSVEVIGDQEGGLLMAVAPNDHLAQITLVVRQRDKRFMDQRIGILPFGVGNMDALPGLKRLSPIQHVFSPTSEGDKPYPLLIERRELEIGGKLGVKHKGGLDPPLDLFPEGEKAHHLIIGFLALDVSGCIKDQLGCSILGKKSQGPFHSFVPGAGPVLIQHGFFPKVRDGVKVQIDDVSLIQLELGGLLDKALLQAQQVNLIEAIGVGGDGRTLGQHIELGKEPRPWIEGMLRDMGVALGAEKLEGQEGQKVAERRDGLGSRQSGLFHHLDQVEFFDKGSKEENPGRLRVKGPLRDMVKSDPLSYRRHLGTLDGHSQLEPCPARESRVALLSQDPFNRADRNFHPFFRQKLCDFSGRQAMFSPTADLGPGSGINAMPSGFALGQGFGEVHLFVGEEVSEKIHIGRRISEALGDHLGRQAIDEGGAQGLIAALPFMDGVKEEFLVPHETLIEYDGYNVK